MTAHDTTVTTRWALRVLTLTSSDRTLLADMLEASEQAREEVEQRMWEVKQQAHTELLCLRKQLAEAQQRIFDLEVELRSRGIVRPAAA